MYLLIKLMPCDATTARFEADKFVMAAAELSCTSVMCVCCLQLGVLHGVFFGALLALGCEVS